MKRNNSVSYPFLGCMGGCLCFLLSLYLFRNGFDFLANFLQFFLQAFNLLFDVGYE